MTGVAVASGGSASPESEEEDALLPSSPPPPFAMALSLNLPSAERLVDFFVEGR